MGRSKKPDPIEQARRLSAVKTMIRDASNATPDMARDLRRNAYEELDEIIAQLAPPAHIRKAALGRGV